jgi:hypothetical protein
MLIRSLFTIVCVVAARFTSAGAWVQSDEARPHPTMQTLHETFASAPHDYGPVPIWWWSGEKLEIERLCWQLDRFAEGHVFNLIVLNLAPSGPLYGSDADDPAFFSEDWWTTLETVLAHAEKRGIKIWFYDQLGFSGASLQAGLVTRRQELLGRQLQLEEIDADGSQPVEWTPPDGAAFLAAHVGRPPADVSARPQWIWLRGREESEEPCYFRRVFELERVPAQACVTITADNGYTLFVNGIGVGSDSGYAEPYWEQAERYDVAHLLRAGRNVLAIRGENLGGKAGLLLDLELTDPGGDSRHIVSDAEFHAFGSEQPGWNTLDFTESADWQSAVVFGPVGVAPWGWQVRGFRTFGTIPELTDIRSADGELIGRTYRWQGPDEPSKLLIFYTMPGGFDYLNPAAGAALIGAVHGEFERRVGDQIGRTIGGGFQDELPAMPHWTAALPDQFRQRKGYDLIERLPELYFQTPDAPRVRADTADVLAALAEESFFRPMWEWHQRFGIFTGFDQVARSGDPDHAQRWYLDYFRTHRWYGAPGNDQDGVTRPHSSMANLYGRPRVWLEGFHSSGWGQTIEEIAHLLHAFYREGATLYNPHAVYYSTKGAWWEWAPPSTCFRQPYWRNQAVFSDYVARMSYLLSQGVHVADVGLIYPSRTVQAYSTPRGPGAIARDSCETYWATIRALDAAGRDLDVIDEDSLIRGAATPSGLLIGDQTFPIVALPNVAALRDESLEKLRELGAGGVPVFFIGEPVAAFRARLHEAGLEIGSDIEPLRLVREAPEFIEAVDALLPRDVLGPVKSLHRRIGDLDLYFLVPDLTTRADSGARFAITRRDLHAEAEQTRELRLSFRMTGAPQLWDALSGDVHPIFDYRATEDRTDVDVDFTHSPAALVIFRKDDGQPQVVESNLTAITAITPAEERIVVDGFAPASGAPQIELRYRGKRYVGRSESLAPAVAQDLGGIFQCRLEPTMNNRWGDLVWPPSSEEIPIDVRRMVYRCGTADGDDPPPGWLTGDATDASDRVITVGFGPKALRAGPIPLDAMGTHTPLVDEDMLLRVGDQRHPAESILFSSTRGIEKDSIHRTSLGPKGHVAERFINLGEVPPGQAFIVATHVRGAASGDVTLHVSSAADKTVWLNGERVLLAQDAGEHANAPVTLNEGWNRVVLLLANPTGKALRSRTALYFTRGPEADTRPEWIGSNGAEGVVRARTVWDLDAPVASARIAIAADGPCQVFVNGELAADLGRYDAYFMSRSQYVDVAGWLQQGRNVLAVRMEQPTADYGLLLDGEAMLADGATRYVISDATWRLAPADAADWTLLTTDDASFPQAKELRGPAHHFMGERASLYLRRRPHPLSGAAWLECDRDGRPSAAEVRREVIPLEWDIQPAATDRVGWFRFVLPPGATQMRCRIVGQVRLFLDGEELDVPQSGHDVKAKLPRADAPRRVIALRIAEQPGYAEGAAFLEPPTFTLGPGTIELGDWRERGLPHYSGTLVYETRFERRSNGPKATLSLGKVRGTAEVEVNGVAAGVRLWHPYEFEVGPLLNEGENSVRIRVANTLGPHFQAESPTASVFEGQDVSGLFGPVRLVPQQESRIEAQAQPSGS